jgi:hypothetical protein
MMVGDGQWGLPVMRTYRCRIQHFDTALSRQNSMPKMMRKKNVQLLSTASRSNVRRHNDKDHRAAEVPLAISRAVGRRSACIFLLCGVEGMTMSLPKNHVTLQDYLSHELAEGKTEFRVVAENIGDEAGVKIYIHPLGKDGDSRDFVVNGSDVEDITCWLP